MMKTLGRSRRPALVLLCLCLGLAASIGGPRAAGARGKKSSRVTWASVRPGPVPGGKGTSVGVYVGAVDGRGEALIVRNGRRGLNPASVMKLVTAWVALERLGPDHRFATTLYNDAPDHLYVKAGGDPMLFYRDLLHIASRLHHRGYRSFKDLVIDASVFSAGTTPPHFDDKASDDAYRGEVGAFSVDYNAVTVRVRPGKRVGDKARVSLFPPSPDIDIVNRSKTIGAKTKKGRKARNSISLETRPVKGRTQVRVGGRIPVSHRAGISVRKKIYQPGSFSAGLMKRALSAAGVSIKGRVRFGRVPKGAKRLLRHDSQPLQVILGEMLRHSNNVIAETLLRQLDPAASGKGFGAGARELRRALAKASGEPIDSLRVTNGSGLYDANRLTVRAVGGLLERVLRSHWEAEYVGALALSGHEGTLKKRLKKFWFRGKTGTLNQSVALAGYLDVSGRGRVPVVVILNGKLAGRAGACRKWIDALVTKLHKQLAR
jgi:serine-type D-Ala-D-Ala carboxypeptidase/endopeptidase (penicillin-binding protein 4)